MQCHILYICEFSSISSVKDLIQDMRRVHMHASDRAFICFQHTKEKSNECLCKRVCVCVCVWCVLEIWKNKTKMSTETNRIKSSRESDIELSIIHWKWKQLQLTLVKHTANQRAGGALFRVWVTKLVWWHHTINSLTHTSEEMLLNCWKVRVDTSHTFV